MKIAAMTLGSRKTSGTLSMIGKVLIAQQFLMDSLRVSRSAILVTVTIEICSSVAVLQLKAMQHYFYFRRPWILVFLCRV